MDAHQDRPLNSSPVVRIENLTKRFGAVTAVDSVSLEIERGEFFCLLGGSGSGKTTLLRMIAGLELPEEGRVSIDGIDVTDAPAYKRPVNMMFQSYALFPHLTVEKNVAFGLQEEGKPKAEIATRVRDALAMLDMQDYGARKPHQLSGGQKQRVAFARALVKHPKILLLDEPLAALDKKLRERAQIELVKLRERVGITFVMVTHDQEEAMHMASRIALMQDGRIVQIGTPRELYEAPVSSYVADFFGRANLFAAKVVSMQSSEVFAESNDVGATLRGRAESAIPPSAAVTMMVRPEHIRLSRTSLAAENELRGQIGSVVFLGGSYTCEITLKTGKAVEVRLSTSEFAEADELSTGDEVYLSWPSSAARALAQ